MFAGRPMVCLTSEPQMQKMLEDSSPDTTEVIYNECVIFKSSIRCHPKCVQINWIKDDSGPLDIENVRYRGSSNDGDSPVLCINTATKKDEGTYRVEAYNAYGCGRSQLVTLKVIGGTCNFLLS